VSKKGVDRDGIAMAPSVHYVHAMKKSRQKLNLNRETLHKLEQSAMKKVGGGYVCRATNDASTCVSKVDTECNCQVTVVATCGC
jgi:hypothetical protein